MSHDVGFRTSWIFINAYRTCSPTGGLIELDYFLLFPLHFLFTSCYLGALAGAAGPTQQDHAVALQVLQEAEPEAPHRKLLALLLQGVVPGGEGQTIVRVHLQVPQTLLLSSSSFILRTPRQEGGHGQRVQGWGRSQLGPGRFWRRGGHVRWCEGAEFTCRDKDGDIQSTGGQVSLSHTEDTCPLEEGQDWLD